MTSRSQHRALYAVCIQRKGGPLLIEVCEAANAAEALRGVLDQRHDGREPDCDWVLVRAETPTGAPRARPPREPRRRTKRSVAAIARTLRASLPEDLKESGVLEAYAAGLLEPRGARRG